MGKTKIEKKDRPSIMSFKGYLIAMLAVIITCVADYILIVAVGFSFIHAIEPLGYFFIIMISMGFYFKKSTGGENLFTAIIFSVSMYLIYMVLDFSYGAIMFKVNGLSMGGYGLLDYIVDTLTDSYYIFNKEITGFIAMIAHIITIIVCTLIYNSSFKSEKSRFKQQQQQLVVQEDFLSRNLDSDMTNPFVQARMWTERGLISKGIIKPNEATTAKDILMAGNQSQTVKTDEQQTSETKETEIKQESKGIDLEDNKNDLSEETVSNTTTNNTSETPQEQNVLNPNDVLVPEEDKSSAVDKVKEMWNTQKDDKENVKEEASDNE